MGGHVFHGLGPHGDVDSVVDLVLNLSGSNGISQVLEESNDLLTSRWVDGLHLDEGCQSGDEWEES